MPKSVTLACWCASSSTLADLMSRWMTWLWCRYATPCATSSDSRESSAGASGVGEPSAEPEPSAAAPPRVSCSRLYSEPPGRHSRTMAGRPCCMHVPRKEQMDGWRSSRRMRTSCTKERSASGLMDGPPWLRTLTATGTEPAFHSPRHTRVMPPSAMSEVSFRSANIESSTPKRSAPPAACMAEVVAAAMAPLASPLPSSAAWAPAPAPAPRVSCACASGCCAVGKAKGTPGGAARKNLRISSSHSAASEGLGVESENMSRA
mmetsp:Transcript_7312/g.17362  ORF Transcript_7312/g.17362 Transcript_7312/m.17362 type:complete len:262 (+) Transcript_7312:741-1526(+)